MDVLVKLSLFLFVALCHGLENLALNKNATMSSKNSTTIWQAGAAVDGDTNQRLSGNSCAVTGLHKGTVSWTVDLGQILAFSEVNILYRDEGDGPNDSLTFRLSGFSIHHSNDITTPFYSTCYRDNAGVQVNPGPSSNLSVPCDGYGRFVSIYKDRSKICNGNPNENINLCALFELCEVEVLGCRRFFYGRNCNERCPNNCLNDICNIVTGNCFSCKIGYNGERCDDPCPYGFYGEGCEEKCSGICRRNVTCHTVDGTCDACSPGWQGPMCNEACSPGTFGDCEQQCGVCFNEEPCDRFNGTCVNGCGEGGEGEFCFTRDQVQRGPSPGAGTGSGDSSLIVGIVVGLMLLIAIIVGVVVFLRWRANNLKTNYQRRSRHYTIDYRKQSQDAVADDEVDDVKYANMEASDVYAQVNKPPKTKGSEGATKNGFQGAQNSAEGDVYAEVIKNKGSGNPAGDVDRNVNQDGLVYLDLEFANSASGTTQNSLSVDNRTEYASVEFQNN